MSTQPRERRGTSAGGRFAAVMRPEVPVILYSGFRLSNPDHVEMAKEAVLEQWLYGNDSTDAALDAIEDMCWRNGMDCPGRLDVLFSSDLSDFVQNRWPADEPNEIEESSPDRIGNVGPTWKGAGFSPAQAARWAHAGVTRPERARRLAVAGVTADDARKIFSDTGGYPVTVGQAANDNEISAEQARDYIAGFELMDRDDAVGF